MTSTTNLDQLKKDFDEKGFAVLDSGLPSSVIDGAIADIKPFFNGQDPTNLVPYADHGRIQDGWYISDNVLSVARAPAVLDALEHLYGAPADPFQTLNFPVGTEQAVHSDSIHFNSEPFGMMCGVWVALEDITEDQGPLIYYPGSQKLSEMNFKEFDLPASYDFYNQYLDGLQNLIKEHDFKPEYGLIKKGQALIWSANLLHGGSPQNNKNLTRFSQVTHYFMGKPKCWRPGYSEQGRAYFTPPEVKAGLSFKSAPPSTLNIDDGADPSQTSGGLSLLKRIERSIKFRLKHYVFKK